MHQIKRFTALILAFLFLFSSSSLSEETEVVEEWEEVEEWLEAVYDDLMEEGIL